MLSNILRQIREVPEYFMALKGAVAILASGLPIYAGLWYFLHRRHIKAHWGFTINFIGVFVLLGGLAFLFASPLAGLLHPSILTAYLFVTCVMTALSIVALIDLFLIQHYLSDVKKLYISPPLRTVIKVAAFCVAILPILHFVLHFNPLTLVAIPTIATAGLALALQDTLKTFIAGVALGKIIRLGEWIGFQDKEGRVVDINWARTVLRTIDGNFVFIPNSQLQTGVFSNYTTTQPANRMTFKIGVSYDASPAQVKRVMLQSVVGVSKIASFPEPTVFLLEYANSSVVYGLTYWLEDYGDKLPVQDEVATRIWYALRREEIEIPYPTRTLHIQRTPQAGRGTAKVVKALQQWMLAEVFYAEELNEVSQFTESRTFTSGETIVKEGDAGQSLFIIVEGSVDVLKGATSSTPLATLQTGEIFGEMSFLTGAPRSATVRARGIVEVLEVQKTGIQKVLARRPELTDKLAQLIAERQAVTSKAQPFQPADANDKDTPSVARRIRTFFGL